MTGQRQAVEALAFGWGDAYLFSYARDRWVALRRDTRRFLTADTVAGLEVAIEADYRDHPVPRTCEDIERSARDTYNSLKLES